MELEGNYWADLAEKKCWRMYADEMDEGFSEMEMRVTAVERCNT
jgi:hypothetical protein